ncbi:MAG: glycosyltransferase family 39 protein [Acidobacteria bacterium]|nr:glycosyltransferase family 39 protein [Acidobacteriota bacterium]
MSEDQTKGSVGVSVRGFTKQESDHNDNAQAASRKAPARRRQTIIIALVIFSVALGVRLLSWHDTRTDVWKVQTVVAEDYRHIARILREGGTGAFLSPSSPLANPNTLGHPPGYSILMALLFGVFGERDAAVQFFQILCDALAAVLVFLIVALLLPRSIAVIAGLLVALSPQFAWNSVLLLPDSLSVLPILLAIYCLARAYRRPSLPTVIAAGALIGLSCWLRANAMLLAPFMTLAIPLLFERGRRLRYGAALLGGTVLLIAPLTIRNAVVFGNFIPISLGAGQTLLEGISDYDDAQRFGIPDTDMGIMKWEAERYNRPDYYGTLFYPDGIKRERMRLAHGFKVIGSHPVWFLGVMARRGASMLRLERVRLISSEPPVTRSLTLTGETAPVWSNTPAELLAGGILRSTQARAALMVGDVALQLTGDDSMYGEQFSSAPIAIRKDTDYVFAFPIKVEQGRMIINVLSAESFDTLSAPVIVETVEAKSPEEQPVRVIQMPFVSGRATNQVRIRFSNGASKPAPPAVQIGPARLFEIGPARYVWTRYPRTIIRGVQKLFLTAIMLPLAIIGLILLARAGQRSAILILLIVPAYYLCVQSATHTEYRYVLAVHYFLFSMSAAALSWIGSALWRVTRKVRSRLWNQRPDLIIT